MEELSDYNFVMINPTLLAHIPTYEIFSYEETTTTKIIDWEGKRVHALFLRTDTAKTSAGYRGFTEITDAFAAANAEPEPEPEPAIQVKKRAPKKKAKAKK